VVVGAAQSLSDLGGRGGGEEGEDDADSKSKNQTFHSGSLCRLVDYGLIISSNCGLLRERPGLLSRDSDPRWIRQDRLRPVRLKFFPSSPGDLAVTSNSLSRIELPVFDLYFSHKRVASLFFEQFDKLLSLKEFADISRSVASVRARRGVPARTRGRRRSTPDG